MNKPLQDYSPLPVFIRKIDIALIALSAVEQNPGVNAWDISRHFGLCRSPVARVMHELACGRFLRMLLHDYWGKAGFVLHDHANQTNASTGVARSTEAPPRRCL